MQGEGRDIELGDTVDLGLPGDDTGLKDAMRVISSVLVLSCGGARQKMDKGRGGTDVRSAPAALESARTRRRSGRCRQARGFLQQ